MNETVECVGAWRHNDIKLELAFQTEEGCELLSFKSLAVIDSGFGCLWTESHKSPFILSGCAGGADPGCSRRGRRRGAQALGWQQCHSKGLSIPAGIQPLPTLWTCICWLLCYHFSEVEHCWAALGGVRSPWNPLHLDNIPVMEQRVWVLSWCSATPACRNNTASLLIIPVSAQRIQIIHVCIYLNLPEHLLMSPILFHTGTACTWVWFPCLEVLPVLKLSKRCWYLDF